VKLRKKKARYYSQKNSFRCTFISGDHVCVT